MNIFKLPDLGEGLPDATIVRWLVAVGDTVKVDQPMVEMETAKAVVEVPSPYAGTITALNGKAGDIIAVGADLVVFDGGTAVAPAPAAPSPVAAAPAPAAKAAAAAGAHVFHLPDLGEGLPDATVVRWLVKEGDTVKLDQPMVEMETAKAVVEVPAPVAGTVAKLHGKAGDVIAVGAVLVEFGVASAAHAAAPAPVVEAKAEEGKRADSGTVVGNVQVGNTIVAESTTSVGGVAVTPVVRALAKKLKVDLTRVKGTGKAGEITQADVKAAAAGGSTLSTTSAVAAPVAGISTANPLAYHASPAVRALARRSGVDLARCQASGKNGTITREDVQRAQGSGVAAPTLAAAPRAPAPIAAAPAAAGRLPSVQVTVSPEPVRGVRRAMAMAMSASHAQVVPVTLMDDANISKWRKGEDSLARYVRALCTAAKVEPALNAWFDGSNMERLVHPEVHVGIAVDMPEGLYVPVVRNAERKSGAELRADVEVLREKIRTKSLKTEDSKDPTITLSNFGSIAGRYGTPIVVPPQVAILGAGRFRNELKLTDKGIENQRMLPLSLSFDHRACTGGEGARFLAALIADLEKPE
ncbi:MAG: 2-oxo acid dehydrogenase subunit E2 [Gammaproteobacteria bacterium]|nr:2-oxo acid dehydrogenase subunit E2 [Gammaproteobacteria bacterium]